MATFTLLLLFASSDVNFLNHWVFKKEIIADAVVRQITQFSSANIKANFLNYESKSAPIRIFSSISNDCIILKRKKKISNFSVMSKQLFVLSNGESDSRLGALFLKSFVYFFDNEVQIWNFLGISYRHITHKIHKLL